MYWAARWVISSASAGQPGGRPPGDAVGAGVPIPKHSRRFFAVISHSGFLTVAIIEDIARQLDTRPARVSKWRQRFAQGRLSALSDAPRPGKPRIYDDETESRVLALLDQPAPWWRCI